MPVSPTIEITYCRLCGWGLRAGWMAQEARPTRHGGVPAGAAAIGLERWPQPLLGGAAIAWPLAARAQPTERVRRIGVLLGSTARKHAEELVALAPDVILASGASSLAPVLQTTRTLPVVFTSVTDPVGAGFVESMSRPGGNATGFIQFEYSLSGKWLELLKQIAPGVARAAVLRDPAQTSGLANSPSSSRWPPRSESRSSRSMCSTPMRSSAP
jgi:hypothetical protein